MKRLIEYLRFSCTHPKQSDFVSMGLGLEARFSRCADAWFQHLNASKKFVNSVVTENVREGATVFVLGSGRLLDLDIEHLASSSRHITLVDYDIAAIRNSMRQTERYQNVSFECVDITGVLEPWTVQLKQGLSSLPRKSTKVIEDGLTEILESLILGNVEVAPVDIVISLNIFSQLRVFWSQRVAMIVSHLFGKHCSDSLLESCNVSHALLRTEKLLETAHVRSHLSSAQILAVLLSDRYFHYYHPDKADWQTEDALASEFPEALEGYEMIQADSWLWHIAPFGREQSDYGTYHDVHARAFART
jgi:hypothetical protein